MDFVSIRLITNDVTGLVYFYEQVTKNTAQRHTEDFAELRLASFTLAIASTRTIQQLGPGVLQPAANQSVVFELRVDDVDAAFERLKGFVAEFVLVPTTMPWGNRSLLLRDPDGNLINLFTPVSPEALQRASR